ncbi:MAG: TRAP transporter large permease subunit, partial [Akkermansiaceae bacterium]|nr:TRAP transporter large permease subunit [Akkermansiaceae bacterium]
PELVKFSGFTAGDAVENFTMTPNGLLGVTTATSLTFVFYFVLFGAVYSGIGGGQFFIDIGLRLAGSQRGGPAKAAVVASGLMGSISGSAVANV